VLELLPTERAGAMLLVVPIPRIQTFEHRELAHLPLSQVGAPDAAPRQVAQDERNHGFLAGADGAALERVGAVDRMIVRARRFLQLGQRLDEIVVATHLAERGDDTADHDPDQIEQRIPDLQDARPARFGLTFGVAQARLRGVLFRVPLGTDAALILGCHFFEGDDAVLRAQVKAPRPGASKALSPRRLPGPRRIPAAGRR
jgi:hypothetical protein